MDKHSKVYIRVLNGPALPQIWHIAPGRDTYLLAAEHAEAMQIAFRVAQVFNIKDVREETQEQIDAQRKKERSLMGRTPLNGHLGMVLRWLILGSALAGFYYGLVSRLERLDYRLDHEFVTQEEQREWVQKLYEANHAVLEVPRF